MTLATGQILQDRYRIVSMLGQGGMGAVYHGTDTQTGRPVAIKLLNPKIVATNPDVVERFAREAEALRALDHPNIVKVLATSQEGDEHYLVMESVPGGSGVLEHTPAAQTSTRPPRRTPARNFSVYGTYPGEWIVTPPQAGKMNVYFVICETSQLPPLQGPNPLSKAFLQDIRERVRFYRDGSDVLAWMLVDEPECASISVQKLKRVYQIVREESNSSLSPRSALRMIRRGLNWGSTSLTGHEAVHVPHEKHRLK